MAKKLFVGGLPYTLTDSQLEQYFLKIGNVVSAKVITDRYSGQGKGFGFVEMGTDEEAKKAISQLNGTTLEGRRIVVNEARPEAPRRDYRGGGGGGRGYGRQNRW
jgi:RNA recognition motif-containing protein